MRKILVTGGAGFIGSHFVELCVKKGLTVTILDLLTYAGNRANLEAVQNSIELIVGDICDANLVSEVIRNCQPDAIFNFAAESHVDRSIASPGDFLQTNIVGTYVLLNTATQYFETLDGVKRADFRFVQISTDEVFGQLGNDGHFNEQSSYRPNSPYSACKAGADHLVNAWNHTFGLPTIITHCSNNYGPRQYPEKLIPFMISNALNRKPMGIYGDGKNVRDWIHVKDHCHGVWLASERGTPGRRYCFGGDSERTNLEVVETICSELDTVAPLQDEDPHSNQIVFVKDRLGHDWRYAIDDRIAQSELGFKREYTDFEAGLRETVRWYVKNQEWCKTVMKGDR